MLPSALSLHYCRIDYGQLRREKKDATTAIKAGAVTFTLGILLLLAKRGRVLRRTFYSHAAGYPDLVADFHHALPNKDGPYPSFQTPAYWEPLIAMLVNEADVSILAD